MSNLTKLRDYYLNIIRTRLDTIHLNRDKTEMDYKEMKVSSFGMPLKFPASLATLSVIFSSNSLAMGSCYGYLCISKRAMALKILR